MPREHDYHAVVTWTGDLGTGTSGYRDYSRNHEIGAAGKITAIPGSSDPLFRGDGSRYNPEELLVASLSACHMLWMLHLCAEGGIVVTSYVDRPTGRLLESEDGSGAFTEVTLRPEMRITDPARKHEALLLHERAHAMCFVARSVNFPVRCEPQVE